MGAENENFVDVFGKKDEDIHHRSHTTLDEEDQLPFLKEEYQQKNDSGLLEKIFSCVTSCFTSTKDRGIYDYSGDKFQDEDSDTNILVGKNVLIVRSLDCRPQTNRTDYCVLVPREPDEEIFEEEAVCKFCFKILKVKENILKTKCNCRNALIHDTCARNWSGRKGNNNCDVCGKEVRNISVNLIQRRSSGKSRKIKGKKGKKWKKFSLFKW